MIKIDIVINQKQIPIKLATTIPIIQTEPFKTYTHEQMAAADVWGIVHGLKCYPSVSIIDTGGNLVIGDIKYVSENELIISFSNAFSGKAYIN